MLPGLLPGAGVDGGLSPAPVSPAAGPACPGRGVSSASVSPESAHMPGGGAVLTGSPGVQSTPDVSSALPRSPPLGPQPRQPAPLEGGWGEGVSVDALSTAAHLPSGRTSPWAPKCTVALYQCQLAQSPLNPMMQVLLAPLHRGGKLRQREVNSHSVQKAGPGFEPRHSGCRPGVPNFPGPWTGTGLHGGRWVMGERVKPWRPLPSPGTAASAPPQAIEHQVLVGAPVPGPTKVGDCCPRLF